MSSTPTHTPTHPIHTQPHTHLKRFLLAGLLSLLSLCLLCFCCAVELLVDRKAFEAAARCERCAEGVDDWAEGWVVELLAVDGEGEEVLAEDACVAGVI
jgi:hypothetical protein